MPRSLEEILAHADELADRFADDFEPTKVTDTDPLEGLQRAVIELSNAQRNVQLWVRLARDEGKSWVTIGAELGTSGEAARQRYGSKGAKLKSWKKPVEAATTPASAKPAAVTRKTSKKTSVADFARAAAARAGAKDAKKAGPRKIAAKQRQIGASSQHVTGNQ